MELHCRFEQTPDDNISRVQTILDELSADVEGAVEILRTFSQSGQVTIHVKFSGIEESEADEVADRLFALSSEIQSSVEMAAPGGWDYAVLAPGPGQYDPEDPPAHLGTIEEARIQVRACLAALASEA